MEKAACDGDVGKIQQVRRRFHFQPTCVRVVATDAGTITALSISKEAVQTWASIAVVALTETRVRAMAGTEVQSLSASDGIRSGAP
ncbi:hypothetical protein [Nitrobacter sp.]|uniref:hypothetical protein n=1 Tax=Nitrobacter sp. TaxID=29420 RepID=UPI00399D744D